jgi:uracil phosphoribosyltransferase
LSRNADGGFFCFNPKNYLLLQENYGLMDVHILDRQNTVLNSFIAQMRDVGVQGDRMRFRRNLERCGEITAYEISKTLAYTTRMVETPLGEAAVALHTGEIVVATILRAGIPYHQGFLNYFDEAGGAFVSAFRKYSKDGTFKVKVEYVSCGDLEGKTLILVDPMLATGTSTVLTYNALLEKGGTPRHTHLASVIASEEGVAYVRQHLPDDDVTIWCGSVDEELTVKSYIIPGLGDAGDLAYGDKL